MFHKETLIPSTHYGKWPYLVNGKSPFAYLGLFSSGSRGKIRSRFILFATFMVVFQGQEKSPK